MFGQGFRLVHTPAIAAVSHILTYARSVGFLLAETGGFEPPEPFGSVVFKTTAIDRSAMSPVTVCYAFA